ncbi:substrate-binding domain-containing protein [Microtetraspora sp. AC03309]|uniref:sugar ABC transporter substrate-binding protein n=1 Tax=Microtetraspora sp. AC03309 TaxID=2779376 RepID=UPI001E5E8074|nr:substrate-binding domain-containing protein [Microtetraspora sp. AC03309]MCC5580618.1 substrate-binding domain-containing protein [Microtetraspora sp. AC03309]
MGRNLVRRLVPGVVVVVLLGLESCGTAGQSGGGPTSVAVGSLSDGFTIGLLLPDAKAARYEKFDRPYIIQRVAQLCPRCEVIHSNAGGDPKRQQRQLASMLADGVKVLILDAVDARGIASWVALAKNQGARVVAYDRLAGGPVDAYTSFDNIQAGRMQGRSLLDAIRIGGDPRRGEIVMVNGSPADQHAGDLKKGAHQVLDGQVTIGKEYDAPGWNPDRAGAAVNGALTALGAERVIGVYAASDVMAGGIATAMRSAGAARGTPLTGRGAELDAVRRILLGTQTMTVYLPIRSVARSAAKIAIDLGVGRTVSGTTTLSNGTVTSIPAAMIAPIVVDRGNIKSTVIKDGYWTAAEICASQFRAACRSAGLF